MQQARARACTCGVHAAHLPLTAAPPPLLQAFEGFRRSYRKNEAIEASKQELKGKYEAAKRLGEHVNGARARINAAKGQIESVR